MSHYKSYPEYKESRITWIGEAPKHWELTRFKYVSELNPKKSTVTTERNELCTFLPMEKLKTDTIILDETRVIDEVYDGYSYFADDDILIAKVTPCFENKNIAVAKGLVNGVGFGSTEINTIRAKANANNRFLYYRLQEDQFLKIAISEMTGSGGLKRVPSELFQNFKIAIPSYDEQALIATQIDKENQRIHTLITKKTRFIELLKEKRQALIAHAVTKGLNPNVKMKDSGVEWIGEIPEHWEYKRLRHVASFYNSNVDKKSYDDQIEVLLCNYTDVYYNEFITTDLDFMKATASVNEISKFRLRCGDIIITKDSEDPRDIGIPSLVLQDMPGVICGYHLTIIRTHQDSLSGFLHRSIQATSTKAHFFVESPGITRFGLGQDEIGDIPVCVPPEDECLKIVSFINRQTTRIDTLINKTQKSIELLKEHRSAFITAAVTGQIDLRGEPA
ncbi:restriction endonuclease subunit S [Proteus terrae subsp. cibarius]|uniref:restriction endonuclease subunit S n=1 Tax=Morganellaceae TaxID=1903414 RepID=UPI0014955049|nr:restriction endonuclease subunit S [Proteus terrae]QKD69002.1 restriction endonuclease subunit S [Proteus terrae subsp. cibarius]